MHLVIVNQYGLPAGSPGITRHGDLGAELVRLGHRVTVIASRFNYLTRAVGSPSPTRVEDDDGVTFRYLETGTYRANDQRRIRSMLSFTIRSVLNGIRLRPRPDLVLGSSPHLLAGLSGLFLARRYGVPFVFEVRDLWPQALVDLGGLRAGSWSHRLLGWLERLIYRRADKIIIVPPHADRRVAEVGADATKCVHIPNATSLDRVERQPLPASLEAVFEQCGSRQVVLYGGAQGVSNGLSVVLDALDVLRTSDPSTYEGLAVVLLGDGGEHDRLVRAAAERGHTQVHFHAPVSKGAVRSALERATILLVSFADAPVYDYGLSPNKLFDYMYAGRPVLLASRLVDDPVTVAGAGRRFEPGSGVSLAREIRELLALPPGEREAMGARGRAVVERDYTIASTAARLDQVLRDVDRRRS